MAVQFGPVGLIYEEELRLRGVRGGTMSETIGCAVSQQDSPYGERAVPSDA